MFVLVETNFDRTGKVHYPTMYNIQAYSTTIQALICVMDNGSMRAYIDARNTSGSSVYWVKLVGSNCS